MGIEMKETKVKKEREKHEAEVMLSEATQTYDDTDQQMKADINFFDDTKEMCNKNNKLWTDRKELRESEINGIKKAIKILTSDDAREQFGKAFSSAAAFVQVQSDVMSPAIQHAYQSIKAQALKAHSLRLARL